MYSYLDTLVSLHFGELLTFGVSLGARAVSWICTKRTMKVEIKKSIILRKLDYAERVDKILR